MGQNLEIDNLTDEELLVLTLEKPALYSLLMARYEGAFRRKASHILGGREEVEDVLQETFTKIYIHGARFKKQEGASFKSWAFKILLNTTFTQYQKLKRSEDFAVHLDQEIWDIVPDAKAVMGGKEGARETVLLALSKIPETLAEVLKLHFIDDKPQKEIAETLGISVSAVKTRIHRAKKEFKKLNLEII